MVTKEYQQKKVAAIQRKGNEKLERSPVERGVRFADIKGQVFEDIRRVLVMTVFCHKDQPQTAMDFETQEERAIYEYRNNPMFHAVINKQVALIMDVLDRHKQI